MILNKTLAGISFSEDTSLNIVIQDLMDGVLDFDIQDDNFNELKGATETILSASVYVRATTTIHLRADSAKYAIWQKRFFSNGSVRGSATLTFDNGSTWTLRKMRISAGNYSPNGQSGDAIFTLSADLLVNTDLIA